MPANYYRVDLRVSPEMGEELEKLQRELYEEKGKKVSKGRIIREVVADFLRNSSRSCFSKMEET